MHQQSPYQQIRQIDYSLRRSVAASDPDGRSSAGGKALEKLQRDIRAATDTLKDYEMFQLEEDLRMQSKALPKAVRSLEKLRESLLKASEYDIVGAVDVAFTSAQLDELIDRLK